MSLRLISIFIVLIASSPSFSQLKYLASGPMLGHGSHREVNVWLQTTEPAKVNIVYWPKGTFDQEHTSQTIQTVKEKALTAHVVLDEVESGTAYEYLILINGKNDRPDLVNSFKTPGLWQYRTAPPNFTIAAGSCTYMNEKRFDRPGKPYGDGYQIFKSIADKNPEVMLWLGDNIYLREVDYGSRSGVLKRYSYVRKQKALQPLLSRAYNYAIWDDHDYGPNDADKNYALKEVTLEAFKLFWANPSYGITPGQGISSSFSYHDVDVFLVDDRFFRTNMNRNTLVEGQMLGDKQQDWLIGALKYSKASFKLVCVGSQVLNDVAVHENYAKYSEERRKFLDKLDAEGIKNIVFLTGDRHHSEISTLQSEKITLYDVTISPLTSGPHSAEDEKNNNRVPNSHIGERNFATLSFSGKLKQRVMSINFFDSDGKKLNTYEIKQR